MSCFLGDGYLVSFQERVGDVFDRLRERLATGTSRDRRKKADYLLYLIIDSALISKKYICSLNIFD